MADPQLHGSDLAKICCAGLVETSNNLAAVKPSSSSDSEAKYIIIMSTRSSLTHAMEAQRARIAAIARLCGATVAQDKAYPGWAPNPASPVLQVTPYSFFNTLHMPAALCMVSYYSRYRQLCL